MASAGLSRVHTGPVFETHPPALCSVVGSRVLGTRAGTGVHLLSSTGCGAEAACKRVVEAGLRTIIPLCDERTPQKERDTTRSAQIITLPSEHPVAPPPGPAPVMARVDPAPRNGEKGDRMRAMHDAQQC